MSRILAPTIKMRRWARRYIETGNARRTTREIYGTQGSQLPKRAYEIKHHPMVQKLIKDSLEEQGLTVDKLADSLNKVVDRGLNDLEKTKTTPSELLKAIDMGAKLRDLYPAEKKKIEKRVLSLHLEGKSPEELQKILKDQEEEIRRFRHLLNEKPLSEEIKDAEVLP